jgi:MFS family permease
VAIGIAGLGAAIYAPAKYGLITELLPANALVRANGFFEGTTVCAVIFGTVLGGLLVSPLMPLLQLPPPLQWGDMSNTVLIAGMLVLLGLHTVATILSIAIADSGARYDAHSIHPARLLQQFIKENLVLWRDPMGGLSMTVTTLLWGVGATLQLVVLRWANESLGLPLAQAAYLQGVTALGVIAGAMLASHIVVLERAHLALPLGILIGALVPVLLVVKSVAGAVVLLIVVGALAGYFVVPMNALLQHRGCTLLTAGRSIAVQGFNENGGMLLMLAAYSGTIALGVPLNGLITLFGVMVAAGMSLIWMRHLRARKTRPLPDCAG